MKLGIGFVVCGRIHFTRKVVNSILEYNPELANYPWVVADDASEPCVGNFFAETATKNHTILSYLRHPFRKGINANLKQMFDWARKNVDILLIYVNDFVALRRIDVHAIKRFFETHSEAGQVQMFHWKGAIGDKKRERSLTNWITGEPIKIEKEHQAGTEVLIEANWVWTDGVNFTRILKNVDYFEDALGLPREEKYIKEAEIRKGRNFMNTGLKVYELADQPYLHLDADGTQKTPNTIP